MAKRIKLSPSLVSETENDETPSAVEPSRTFPKTIMDLPDEMLTEIFLKIGKHKNIQSLRKVCTRFECISDGILRRAFIEFERDVAVQIAIAKSDYERALSESGVPPKPVIPILNLSHRLHAFQTIASVFAVFKIITRNSPDTNERHLKRRGHTLDHFVRNLKKVQKYKSSPTIETNFDGMLSVSNPSSFRWDKFNQLRTSKHYFGCDRTCAAQVASARDMLCGMSVLSLLETCMDVTCKEAWINKRCDRSRIRVRYTMNRSWLQKVKLNPRRAAIIRLVNLLQLVKDMVIIINDGYLQKECRLRYEIITGRGCPTEENEAPTKYEIVQETTLMDFIFTLMYRNPLDNKFLESYSGIQLYIDATCFTEDFPKSLIEKCTPDCSMHVDEDCCFELGLTPNILCYSKETLSYSEGRPISRPLHYQARCSAKKYNYEDEDDNWNVK